MFLQHKIAIGVVALAAVLVAVVVPVVLLTGNGSNAAAAAIDSSTPPVSVFGLDFLSELSNAQPATKNVFVSPLSLWYCLGMATYGMNGSTLTQSLSALRVDSKQKLVSEATRLRSGLTADGNRTRIANYMLHKQNLAVKQEYKDAILNSFGAPVDAVNSISAQDVNNWFSTNTAGRIKDVVNENDLKEIVMTLMNAVYFKSNWTQQFNTDATETSVDFNGGNSKVTMMKQMAQFRVYDSAKEFKALALPYWKEGSSASNLAAVIILPNEGNTVSQTLSSLKSGARYIDMVKVLKESETKLVNVRLPKFKLETKYKDETKSTLEKLGMELMFKSDQADFSGIVEPDGLFVSFVIHQTFLDVDEAGTEAAAITLVGFERAAAPIAEPIQFHVTRSFLFTIVNLDTQDLLFAGVINEPET